MKKKNIENLLMDGVRSHQEKRFAEAEQCYQEILDIEEDHPHANHNMGVLNFNLGKVEQSIPFLLKAFNVNDKIDQFWLSYIDALSILKKRQELERLLNLALEKKIKTSILDRIKTKLAEIKNEKIASNDTGAPPNDGNLLDGMTLNEAFRRSKKKISEQRFNEAKQIYNAILERFPKNKRALRALKELQVPTEKELSESKLKELLALYNSNRPDIILKQADELSSRYLDSAIVRTIIGAAYAQKKQYKYAIDYYKRAIKLDEKQIEAYNNIGVAYNSMHDFKSAISYLKKAISISPNRADLYNNLGISLKGIEDFDTAANCFMEAIKIKGNFSEAQNNLGVLYKQVGRKQLAIRHLNEACKIKPDYVDAHYNLGNLYQEEGNISAAIDCYKTALLINPEFNQGYYNLGVALTNHSFVKLDKEIYPILEALLTKANYVRPNEMVSSILSLLGKEKSLVNLHDNMDQILDIDQLFHAADEITKFPLLTKLMEITPISDLKFEKTFKVVRSSVLKNLETLNGSSALNDILSHLALHYFTNEFVPLEAEWEKIKLQQLEKRISSLLQNGSQPSLQEILCFSTYRYLYKFDWCEKITFDKNFSHVEARIVREPIREKLIKKELISLKKISNKVSLKVRAQYEANPYPRWVKTGLNLKPMKIQEVFEESGLKIYSKDIFNCRSPKILVAGCGTGRHSIGTAHKFIKSNVLAIDLSHSSLAYAIRKTDELGLSNIDYKQADILDLGGYSGKFDIIESSGVLHHMAKPMDGWKVLTDCLRLGGLMRIGLYSELARGDIVKTRDEITKLSLVGSDDDIREFRQELINLDKPQHKYIMESIDFYSLSSIRDLLFHVQEHRFTILQIGECLKILGLDFCGFENKQIVKMFKNRFNGSLDEFNLNLWHLFEQENPQLFFGMYQFWCQKR